MIAGFYAVMWAGMTKTAQKHGYCLALHGSMNRDLDVVAIPWVKKAVSPTCLINALVKDHNLHKLGSMVEKPHGRVAQSLGFPKDYMQYGHYYIDLSIMPRIKEDGKL